LLTAFPSKGILFLSSVDVFDRVTLLPLYPASQLTSSAHYYRTIPYSVKAKASGLSPLPTFLVVEGAIAFSLLVLKIS
jgi:hypothetical protein